MNTYTIAVRKRLLSLFLGIILITGAVAYLWSRLAPPDPPAVLLTGVDPAVVKVVEDSRAAVRQSPRSAAAWGRLGMVLVVHDFHAEANRCFAQAERLDPRDPHWPYYQGITLFLGDPEAAIPKLRRAVDLCGDRPNVPRLRLAETLFAQGYFDEAAEHFRWTRQHDPNNARAHLGLARVAYERNEWEESRNHLSRSILSPFTRKAAHALLAEVYQRQGNQTAAEAERQVVAQVPDDFVWHDPFAEEAEQLRAGKQGCLARAEKLLAQNRLAEAIALFQEQVRDEPTADWAFLWLGQLFLQQDDLVAAERALRETIRLTPASAAAHFHLGVARFRRHNFREAAACFQRAAEWKPDYALAHYNLGHCRKQLEDRGGAIEAFRMAVRCRPSFADAHTNLGDLLAQNGQTAEALAHLRNALALNPRDARARNLLGQVLRQILSATGPGM
jgi:tetratricopeptide (TPR) repeat protein